MRSFPYKKNNNNNNKRQFFSLIFLLVMQTYDSMARRTRGRKHIDHNLEKNVTFQLSFPTPFRL